MPENILPGGKTNLIDGFRTGFNVPGGIGGGGDSIPAPYIPFTTLIGDADYQMTKFDRVLITSTTLTAQRTITLPRVWAVPKGTVITLLDAASSVLPATDKTWLMQADPLDGIFALNVGNVAARLSAPRGFIQIESDGKAFWTILNQSVDIQYFASSGTWTKRPGYNVTRVVCVGGGGGGGSGDSGTSGAAGGGSGGGGGAIGDDIFLTSVLSATETVTVGGTAAGGTSSTTALGKVGTTGNDTTFGAAPRVRGVGGIAGIAGGTAATGTATGPSGAPWRTSNAGGGVITGGGGVGQQGNPGTNRGLDVHCAGAGSGGGAGITGAGTAGGIGGIASGQTAQAAAGTAGGAAGGGVGGTGNTPAAPTDQLGGGGGGGGGGGTTGGNGGPGGTPGGGGGGGGGAVSANASGAGGLGAAGACIVISTR